MKKFRTRHNYDYTKEVYAVRGKSQTIPGQSLTPREILQRHTRGQEVIINNMTFALTDDQELEAMDMIEYEKLDRVQIAHLQKELDQYVKDQKEALKDRTKLAHEQKKEAEAQKKDSTNFLNKLANYIRFAEPIKDEEPPVGEKK